MIDKLDRFLVSTINDGKKLRTVLLVTVCVALPSVALYRTADRYLSYQRQRDTCTDLTAGRINRREASERLGIRNYRWDEYCDFFK